MFTITKEFRFEAAHRILGHQGKCAHIHGHSYRAEVTVESEGLDKLGMVIDFSYIKKTIGDWIDSNWDHNYLMCSADPLNQYKQEPKIGLDPYYYIGRIPFIMPHNQQPAAENLAFELFQTAEDIIETAIGNVKVVSVTIYETSTCSATYTKVSNVPPINK